MNKPILATLAISIGLVGCGGSSSSTSSETTVAPTTFDWQVVQLISEDEGILGNNCIIYADSESYDGEVITALQAETDFNILYHNADGTIASTFHANDFSNGLVTITEDDVPEDGFVSLEEVDGGIGETVDVFMLSIHKSLLSDLVVNVRQDQSGSCYQGSDYRVEEEETSAISPVVNVSDLSTSGASYYQTSYDLNSVDGQINSSEIPAVISSLPAEHELLITVFDSFESDQTTELSHYAFVDNDYIYDSDDDSAVTTIFLGLSSEVDEYDWAIGDTLTLEQSDIYAVHEGVTYLWQNLYTNVLNFDIATDDENISHWASYFTGTETDYNWEFESYIALGSNISVELPALTSLSDATIEDSVIDDIVSFNLNTSSFDADDFTLQRTQFRTVATISSVDNSFYQTIYAPANSNQVLMNSSELVYDDTSDERVTLSLQRVEVNLVISDADSSDAVPYLMAANMDIVGIAEDPTMVDNFTDCERCNFQYNRAREYSRINFDQYNNDNPKRRLG